MKIGENNKFSFLAVDKNKFEKFLFHLDNLKKCINFDPKINLAVNSNVKLGGKKVDNNFDFWMSIKKHVDLFGSLETDKLEISKATE